MQTAQALALSSCVRVPINLRAVCLFRCIICQAVVNSYVLTCDFATRLFLFLLEFSRVRRGGEKNGGIARHHICSVMIEADAGARK